MKYVDREDLPVEITNNELPIDDGRCYKMFHNDDVRTSGGFVDAIFLAGIMVSCFLWGMLAVILRG